MVVTTRMRDISGILHRHLFDDVAEVLDFVRQKEISHYNLTEFRMESTTKPRTYEQVRGFSLSLCAKTHKGVMLLPSVRFLRCRPAPLLLRT